MSPFDLHVLGTPPAFILSQDQTLYQYFKISKDLKEFFADSITSLLSVSNFILLRVPRFYQGIFQGITV